MYYWLLVSLFMKFAQCVVRRHSTALCKESVKRGALFTIKCSALIGPLRTGFDSRQVVDNAWPNQRYRRYTGSDDLDLRGSWHIWHRSIVLPRDNLNNFWDHHQESKDFQRRTTTPQIISVISDVARSPKIGLSARLSAVGLWLLTLTWGHWVQSAKTYPTYLLAGKQRTLYGCSKSGCQLTKDRISKIAALQPTQCSRKNSHFVY